jgi:hypothetical protein
MLRGIPVRNKTAALYTHAVTYRVKKFRREREKDLNANEMKTDAIQFTFFM